MNLIKYTLPYFQIKTEITEIVTKVNDRETISNTITLYSVKY